MLVARTHLLVPSPTSGGALALELGAGQAQAVAAFCREAGLVDVQMRRDLGAIERVVSAKKP